MCPEMIKLNRKMERKWRSGKITFSQFSWHLHWMCGV